jgi:Icc-related predicted phosphoesterase
VETAGIVKPCFFVSDLHGDRGRYQKLFDAIAAETPSGVFLGGDLLPSGLMAAGNESFVKDFLAKTFLDLAARLGKSAPEVFLILGNDDLRVEEAEILNASGEGAWAYAHMRPTAFGPHEVFGYSFVPPTPFLLKDWERYDVSRFVDPGCVSPEEGRRSIAVPSHETQLATIEQDLEKLAGARNLDRAIFLIHSPPYDTPLDRAALDGKNVDHAPMDVHVGSIAVRRFIEKRQPLLTLHGHVHESTRLTGAWKCRIGRTHALNAAHDGPELALVRFDPDDPGNATREII